MTAANPEVRTAERPESSDAQARPRPASLRQKRLRFFFKQVQLHLELSDLPIELSLYLVPGSFFLRPAMGEDLRQDGQQMLPPLADLIGVDPELGSDLSDRLLPLDRFQGDSGLEGRLVLFPHVRHFSPYLLVKIWQAKMHLCPLSSFWGPAHLAEYFS